MVDSHRKLVYNNPIDKNWGVYMYLKSLELCGFKSFPEKIDLTFDSGITAIVGPNGSGKSNISDAIRWVLGEQSAKHLRGSKMEDVIFAGTQSKKPLGFAEVSMTIDNSDRKMNIEFNEVTITRRVFRSGESEYYINRAACRLKDIHELFMDTGLGRDGYSIIGQGQVDEIIHSKPEDRRSFFEEAAGISKYKYRKAEAERKLSQVQDNITRIDDIISELELQVGPLKTQSEKAKKYLDLREQLKKYEVNLYIGAIAKNKEELSELDKNRKITEDSFGRLEKGVAEAEQKTAEYFAKIEEIEGETTRITETVSTLETQNNHYKNDILLIQNTIKHNKELIERLNREISEQDFLLNQNETAIAEKEKRIDYFSERRNELAGEIDALSGKMAEIEQELRQKTAALNEQKDGQLRLRQQLNDIDTSSSNGTVLLEQYRTRCSEIEQQQKEKEEQLKGQKAERRALAEQNEKLSEKLRAIEAELDSLKEQEAGQAKRAEQNVRELNEAKGALDAAVRRHDFLLDMERDMEGYQKSVKTVMGEYQKGRFDDTDIYGPVSSLLQTEPKYAVAVEQALGGAMQNIVVGREEDAKTVIQYLKQNKAGRVTFLPVSSIQPRSLRQNEAERFPGYIGIADSLVTYDKQFENVVKSLLGTTVVMDTIDHAIALNRRTGYKYRIVTLEGEILAAGGAISGGFSGRQTGILSRNAQISELKKQIGELKKKQGKLEGIFRQDKQAAQVLLEKKQALESGLTELRQEEIRQESRELHFASQIEQAETDRNNLISELTVQNSKIKLLQEQMESNSETVAKIKETLEEAEQNIHYAEIGIGKVSAQREQCNTALIELRLKLSDTEKDLSFEQERKKALQDSILSKEEQAKQKKLNIDELLENNDDLADDISFKEKQIEEITEEIEGKKAEIQRKHNDRKALSLTIQEIQKEAKDKQSELLLVQQEKSRLESKSEKLETENDSMIERLWEDYNLTYAAAQELKADIGKAAKPEIKRLKNEIAGLGSVNVDAIEEYKRVSERYEFLSTQKEDLVVSKDTLQKVITEMQQIMKDVFGEKFKEINENFVTIFKTLFGGGNAKIYLADENDLLESGVEIEVQPPGKKLQNLSLLSGGEKAFTAIALLFAIIKTRPTPFCIFDEIEAALDDVNVYKFAEYIKQYTKDTQFIVVTHRRGTMESADMLYGVTMQQKGISQLLKLKFEDIEKYGKE